MTETHCSVVKISSDGEGEAKTVTLEIACQQCGGSSISFPAVHLLTVANACAELAKVLNVHGVTEHVADSRSAPWSHLSVN